MPPIGTGRNQRWVAGIFCCCYCCCCFHALCTWTAFSASASKCIPQAGCSAEICLGDRTSDSFPVSDNWAPNIKSPYKTSSLEPCSPAAAWRTRRSDGIGQTTFGANFLKVLCYRTTLKVKTVNCFCDLCGMSSSLLEFVSVCLLLKHSTGF